MTELQQAWHYPGTKWDTVAKTHVEWIRYRLQTPFTWRVLQETGIV